MKKESKRLSFREAFREFAPLKKAFVDNWKGLAVGLLCLTLVDGIQLYMPFIIKDAVDALTRRVAAASDLLSYALLILCLAGIAGAVRYIWRTLLLGHARIVERGLRARLYGHIQTLSASFFQDMPTGDLMARSTNDINSIRMATGIGLVSLLDGTLMAGAAICIMVYIHPLLTLIAMIPAPLVVLASRRFSRRMAAGYEATQRSFGDVTERVREAFAGIRVVKAYGREEWTRQRVHEKSQDYVAVNLRLAKSLGMFYPLMAIFTNVGLAVVVGLGGRLAIMDQISIGDFVAFTVYLNLLTWPMMAMGWVTNLVQRGGASMRRINGILTTMPEIVSRAPDDGKLILDGGISVKSLNFHHPGVKAPALDDLSLEIPKGSVTAIVGPVGCGKSTLLHTLVRLMDPPEGAVFFDGRDVHDIPLGQLRRSLGFVTQIATVFSDSIEANVVFGRPDISRERALEALAAASFDQEVLEMEKGLDTLVGERGITLSGGQRQRLCLARAMVEDPPILILDDALSMVDTRTEEKIVNQLLSHRQGRTTILVTHRMSTLKRADNIFVLDKGRIVESGKHQDLIDHNGLYAALYRRQQLSNGL
ncbi:ABC transporter ATP-binding protein [Desulfatibacillum aliphaticivorans]|uniref:ABC transporter ATP-binding protein n=1 Tax=Desulfatibacillum aliphaticivorans TaxID=218208 RepID=UPI0003FC49BE|nr:ABC transporter ATP-binding protein [Desulfatibacillum aliphaticivorans]